ncbi:hypothetical protein GCK32_012543, partial [Trichostrongylus colubriformis]
MGTSASAHRTAVKSISIDQNGWNRPCTSERGSSAASRRSLPILSNWIGNVQEDIDTGIFQKSSRGDGGLTKTERLRLVDRAMRAESAAVECEGKMKGLEREIRTLELRNHDLSTEVCWLRQQCTIACPDVPDGSMASFVPPNCSEQCQVEKKVLHDKIAKQNGELSGLRMEVDRMIAADLRKDIRISELMKELEGAKTRVQALEDLCRDHMSGARRSSHFSVEGITEGGDSSWKSASEEHTEPRKTEDSNLRLLTSRPRPSLRNIFTASKERQIDGKARPSTAIESPSGSFSPPPLERTDTVPVLRSIQILKEIPHDKHHKDEQPQSNKVSHDNSSYQDKELTQDAESDDSDIDITDILESSTRSTAWLHIVPLTFFEK